MTRLRCRSHTPCPTDRATWLTWAHSKSRHWRQVKCRQCGEMRIWVPKRDDRRYFLHAPMSARTKA